MSNTITCPDRAPLHASAGEALRLPFRQGDHDAPRDKPLCARVDRFSLHAARTVAQDDRDGLERLCCYGLRAPFSQDRLSLNRSRLRPRLPKPTPRHRPDAPCSSTAADPAPRARTKAIEGHPGTQPEVPPPRHLSRPASSSVSWTWMH